MLYNKGYVQKMAQILLGSSDPEVVEKGIRIALKKARETAHHTYELRRLQKKLDFMPKDLRLVASLRQATSRRQKGWGLLASGGF
jgi:hypothetical protein